MKLLYQLFTVLYPFIAKLIAPVNAKAAAWTKGRLHVFNELSSFAASSDRPVIWMHCSSLGEFEQGLPVAEQLKIKYPHYRLLVSFFSPSGYLVRKNHPIADFVCYLPMDNAANSAKFLDLIRPQLAVFIKYEFWYYYLQGLKYRGIPTLLISGIFRDNQVFFKWYGDFYRKMLACFSYLLVQDDHSNALLTSIGLGDKTETSGDTRFDRVLTIAHQAAANKVVEHFCSNQPTIVAGSTWSEDDKALHHLAIAHHKLKFIIAPHDIEEGRLKECLTYYPKAALYSDYKKSFEEHKPLTDIQTLIINNMGMLSSLYKYGEMAFIGGGFTEDGIHNTLEAAVYGIPVVFGPVYEKYIEAVDLINIGAAYTASDVVELEKIFNQLLNNNTARERSGQIAQQYIYNKAGATQKIMHYIQENRLLTSE